MHDLWEVLLIGLALGATGGMAWLWVRLEDARSNTLRWKDRLELKVAQVNRLKGRIEKLEDEEPEKVRQLRELLEEVRAERHEEAQTYLERVEKYEQRISELVRQTQNMAERIASLRQEGMTEGGEDFHIEEIEPEEPWSKGLREFYEAVKTPQAQEQVEEFIQTRRDMGIADEQILRELEEM